MPFEVTHRALPGLPADDAQARYIEVTAGGHDADRHLPAERQFRRRGGFAYKLRWMEALRARAAALLEADTPLVIAGDFNVCPTDDDFAPGALPPTDALVRPESRARFRALLWLGLTDAMRALHPHGPVYTFWDYQAGAWPRDSGLRIDHALLSPTLAERLTEAAPDRRERGEEQASDHVPVVVEF